jgi:hypothetical protein
MSESLSSLQQQLDVEKSEIANAKKDVEIRELVAAAQFNVLYADL